MLVVRKDLGMSSGKLAAQAAHVALSAFTKAPGAEIRRRANPAEGFELVVPLTEDDIAWLNADYKKVTVFVNSEAELLEVHRQALEAGLRVALVVDNGLSELKGKNATALAVGPHIKERLAAVTGHLPTR